MNTVLLLPGMMCDARLWSSQRAALCADGFDARIVDYAPADSVVALAQAVLATAPARFALAGLSMGGIIAFEVFRQARDRITHLALLDTNPHPETPERREARSEEIALAERGALRELITERLKPRYLAERSRNDAALRELIVDMALSAGPDAFRRQSVAVRDRPDSVPTLKELNVPTLVLCGREDSLCPPAYHEFMAEHAPDADLVMLSRCGHMPPLERPEAVTNALRLWMERA